MAKNKLDDEIDFNNPDSFNFANWFGTNKYYSKYKNLKQDFQNELSIPRKT